jgi:ketosteroid isomerase-like protein
VSEQNVEVARAFTEAFNAGDIEGVLACCHPEVEFHSTFAQVGGATYRGHAGMRRWHRELRGVWNEGFRSEPEAFFDLGEQTLVYTVLSGAGRQSGIEAELPVAAVVRFRDGLIVYYRGHIHREDALSELGVAEDELEPIYP